MSIDENIDENFEDEEEIDLFFSTLSQDDYKQILSAPEIRENFETMNEILEPLRDAENEFQNPDLKITKTVRSKLQIITPSKELDGKNANYIKDILHFQKGYETNAEEANKTIELVKDSFKGLSDSVTALIKLIENIKKKYFEHAKQMMSPITKKNEDFKNMDKSKLNGQVKTKNDKLDEKIKLYDQKLAKVIKDLKEVFKRINSNIKGYLDFLNNLDKPINLMIEEIEKIFNDFEEKSKIFINIIYNSSNKKTDPFKIFKEIEELDKKIIALIEKQKNELNSQDQILKKEKEKCTKDFNEIKKLEKESSKKINELQKETKNIISEINEILTLCSLPKIDIQIEEFKGLEIDKIQEKVVEGTNNILKANSKFEGDLSNLKKFVEENDQKINEIVTLDLSFIMDITGSMSSYLDFVKEKILTIIDKITQDSNVKVRLGFVGYRDYLDSNDKYLIYPELTNNCQKVKQFISSAKAGGGKDCEDMGGGLQNALNYDWKSNTRFAILLADAPCHGEQYHEIKKFDSKPKGDPKYKIDQLVQKFAELNINLMCLNITEMTVKLYNNFVDYYKKGRKDNNSSSIFVGVLEDGKKETEYLVDLIAKQAKEYYEKRHNFSS